MSASWNSTYAYTHTKPLPSLTAIAATWPHLNFENRLKYLTLAWRLWWRESLNPITFYILKRWKLKSLKVSILPNFKGPKTPSSTLDNSKMLFCVNHASSCLVKPRKDNIRTYPQAPQQWLSHGCHCSLQHNKDTELVVFILQTSSPDFISNVKWQCPPSTRPETQQPHLHADFFFHSDSNSSEGRFHVNGLTCDGSIKTSRDSKMEIRRLLSTVVVTVLVFELSNNNNKIQCSLLFCLETDTFASVKKRRYAYTSSACAERM